MINKIRQQSVWVESVLPFLDAHGLVRMECISKSLALNTDSDWKQIVMRRWLSLGSNVDLLASCMGSCKRLYLRRAHAFGEVARQLSQSADLMFGLA